MHEHVSPKMQYTCSENKLILGETNWNIGLMSRVFTNGLGDLGSLPG